MDDIHKVWKNTTAQCSLHPNATNSLMFTYNLACEQTRATLRLPADLSIIFPKLEKLRIHWSYDRRGHFTCPKPQMDSNQRWPRNLSKIEFTNLPTAYLPAIRNSQVKHFEIDGCGDLTQVRNIWFFSPLVPSKRERNQKCITFAQLVCIFFEGSVFTFQILNDKIHNYAFFDVIVNFIIQKLKSKHLHFPEQN